MLLLSSRFAQLLLSVCSLIPGTRSFEPQILQVGVRSASVAPFSSGPNGRVHQCHRCWLVGWVLAVCLGMQNHREAGFILHI